MKRFVGAVLMVAGFILVAIWIQSGELPGDLRPGVPHWINPRWLVTFLPGFGLAVTGLILLDLPSPFEGKGKKDRPV